MKTKSVIILFILVFTTSIIWAESGSKGFGVTAKIDYTLDDDNTNEDTESDIYISPFFAMMLSDNLELDIIGIINLTTDKTDGTVTNEHARFGLGVGVYNHILQGKIFDFSVGAKGQITFGTDKDYYAYSNVNISLSIPVALDVKFSDHVTFRIQHTIADLTYYSRKSEFLSGAGEESYKAFYFDSYHNSTPFVELGFVFWL